MGKAIIIPDVDFSVHHIGKVTLSRNVPVSSLAIVGEDEVVGKYAYYKVRYYPSSTNQRGIVWSILSGSEYASINSSGKLTIKSTANESSVTIKATSANNAEVYATFDITVTFDSSVYGEDLTPDLTWADGYFDENYDVASSESVKYSSPIAVNRDDILLCKIIGRGMRPVIECDGDYSNPKYGILLKSAAALSLSEVFNYAYHIANDGFAAFCSKQSEGVSFWRAEKIADIVPSWQNGYIDYTGTVQSSSVTKHSEPIQVSAGDIIVIKTAGVGFSLVSLTDQNGTYYQPILGQKGGTIVDHGEFKNGNVVQPNAPFMETSTTYYQGVSNPTNTPVTYAIYIAENGYISVCGKTGLGVEVSKYKAG